MTTSAAGTVLTWTSVADLPVSSTFTLTYRATPDPGTYPVGSTVLNDASAYANTDPFVTPEFDDAGTGSPAR